jgi:hypothetical protein
MTGNRSVLCYQPHPQTCRATFVWPIGGTAPESASVAVNTLHEQWSRLGELDG